MKISNGKLEGIDVSIDGGGFGSNSTAYEVEKITESLIRNIIQDVKVAQEGHKCVRCGGLIKDGKCEHCGLVLQVV